jgi:hypothetical protein
MFRSYWPYKYILTLVASAVVIAFVAAAFSITRHQPSVPVANAASAASSSHQSIDLGAGYRLEMDAQSGQIIAPETILKAPAENRTLDLGDGYRLELDANGGQIVVPAAVVKTQAQPTVLHKIDLGSGYWLIITTQGGQIVQGGSR